MISAEWSRALAGSRLPGSSATPMVNVRGLGVDEGSVVGGSVAIGARVAVGAPAAAVGLACAMPVGAGCPGVEVAAGPPRPHAATSRQSATLAARARRRVVLAVTRIGMNAAGLLDLDAHLAQARVQRI